VLDHKQSFPEDTVQTKWCACTTVTSTGISLQLSPCRVYPSVGNEPFTQRIRGVRLAVAFDWIITSTGHGKVQTIEHHDT